MESSFVFLPQFAHFDRDDVALKGFAQYFLHQAYEELDHALKLIRYTNKRGGRAKFCEIRAPEKQSWTCIRDAMQTALETEKRETSVRRILFLRIKLILNHSSSSSSAPDGTSLDSQTEAGSPLVPLPDPRLYGHSTGIDERAGLQDDAAEYGWRWGWAVSLRQELAKGRKKAN